MNEKEIQAAKYEAKFNFREVNRSDFNEFMISIKSNIKLLDVNQVVYYTPVSSNRVLAKSDYYNGRFYITKKNTITH